MTPTTPRNFKNPAATLLPTVAMAALMLSGCATGPNATPGDPLEPFNRGVFQFNDKLDTYVAAPLARGYQDVVPTVARTGVTNFFSNLGDVGNAANNLLQGKVQDGADSLIRVVINTVFGIGGLFDVATASGLQKHPQDTGRTLAAWGIGAGPYLVLPLFGPSDARDAIGLAGDLQLDPVRYAQPTTRTALYGLNFVNTRANLLGATDLLQGAALDPYSFVRDAYQQQRRYLIDKNAGKTSLPTYDDQADDEATSKPAEQPAAAPAK